MRKLVSAVAIAAGLALVAGPAFAQTTGSYPTPTNQQVRISETALVPGESFTVAGSGAEPGATVTFTLRRSSSALGGNRALAATPRVVALTAAIRQQSQSSVSLGSTTANGDGEFSATLRIPAGTDPGVYTLTASSGGDVLAVVTVRVLAATTGGLGDLPFTGGNVLPGLVIGATLIVAGGLLLLSLKRRRSAA
jgi:LPXTG cell wall anchor motif